MSPCRGDVIWGWMAYDIDNKYGKNDKKNFKLDLLQTDWANFLSAISSLHKPM